MDAQYTPGPWAIAWYECRANRRDADELKDGTKEGDVFWRLPVTIGPVSAAHSHWGGVLIDIEEADAHLVAAAPELYASLKALLDFMQCDDDEMLEMRIQGRAALAKARGEQP